MTAPAASTLIDRIDENDEPIGTIARGRALAERANFRTAHVFVVNSAGELLLQRLSPARERHPGRWGSSVAAYLFAGESYEAAALRRCADELCLEAPITRVGKIAMRDEASLKFVTLFLASSDVVELCDSSHIAEVRFSPMDAIRAAIGEDPEGFTPTFRELFPYFLTNLSTSA